MERRKLPIGIQDFIGLRQDGFIYIDKTAFIYKLANAGKTYFLSRPRRFGKSLLLSTMAAYFRGKKELFQGLAIEQLEAQEAEPWKEHAVIRVDFSTDTFAIQGNLEKRIDYFLQDLEQEYGTEKAGATFGVRFEHIIREAYKKSGRRVVVLIDEYDKPMIDASGNAELSETNREILRGFYSVLKGNDEYLRFVFFTGVTKFSKISIFSDLNQPDDISLTNNYATLCGITENELEKNFRDEITAMAEHNQMDRNQCLAKLRCMYDGYCFYQNAERVYNPFSLLNALSKKDFNTYWFSTGTPTFLIKKLEKGEYDFRDFSNGITADAKSLSDYRIDNPDPVPLFYQSGYLTIKEWNREYEEYTLRYPNDEVKYAFIESLAPTLYNVPASAPELSISSFSKDIRKDNLEGVMNRFKALFARLPYTNSTGDKPLEYNFQNVIYIVFILLGKWSQVEMHTAFGRADCILKTEHTIYIFEFKRDGSVDEALAQIEQKKYADAYTADSRPVVKVGVSFSSAERNITDWKTT